MKKLKKILLITLGVLTLLCSSFLALVYIPSPNFEPVTYEPIAPDSWPTDGFQTSTPEEQGMDSEKLLEMLTYYEEQSAEDPEFDIDSITIVRNGTIIADLYFDPLYPENTLHVMHSCTKSVMSTLIGIAIEQGYIESVDVPVIEFFPDKNIPNMDPGMAEVTLRDLLTMQTGIRSQDSYLYGYRGLFAAQRTDDWVAYTLSLPMDVEPGTRFDYSNLSSFLLSAIIHETTGMDTLSYARENLFEPLGIEDVRWATSPQGINIGWARMWLKPHDMAKFGMLYLQKGQWDGQQVVPAAWVEESVTPHAFPKNYHNVLDENGEKDDMPSGENWVAMKFIRPFSDGYGYQWWLDKNGTYTALGTGGQYILVSPEENLVVVVTSQSSGMGVFKIATLFEDYIREAVVSDQPLAPNLVAQNELAAASPPPELILDPQPVPPLPSAAMVISGSNYLLEENNWNYDNFQLIFDPEADYAAFSYTTRDSDVVSYHIGLNNVYHFTDTAIGTFAAVGTWTSPDTFEIWYQQIGYSNPGKWTLTFNENAIEVIEEGVTGEYRYSGIQQ
jgi:CubicO group peptidase (beta-lactamase class C family)